MPGIANEMPGIANCKLHKLQIGNAKPQKGAKSRKRLNHRHEDTKDLEAKQ
jgi:hypothetical protein